METLTSRQNPRIKSLIGLKDKKGRNKTKSFAVEGLDEIKRAFRIYEMLELYFCPSLETARERDFRLQLNSDSVVIEITPDLMKLCAYRENPRGLLAVFKTKKHSLADLRAGSIPSPLVILSSVEKPGNIGAIARTALAAGVQVLGFCHPKTDLYNPNVIRASRGHWFGLDKAVATPEEWVLWLKERDITPVRTIVKGQTPFWGFDWKQPVAILLGAEDEGLDPQWETWAPAGVTIPMAPSVDSLNVSVSAALLLYEIKRQHQ